MERERVLILSASAGSGKTYRLAYKYVRDVIKYCHTKPHLYRAILAVTFTNKATEEMKNRILEKIDELINNPAKSAYMEDLKTELKLSQEEIISRARKIQSHILHDYSRFTVLTIDKFFQRILRAFIKELGLDLNYNIELDAETILARGTDSLIEEITQDEELQRWMLEYAEENIDDNGNWDLRKDLLKLGDDIFKDSSKQAIVGSKPREELLKIIRSAQERVAKSKAKLKTLGEESLRIIAEAGVSEDVFINKKTYFTFIHNIAEGNTPNLTAQLRGLASKTTGWSKDSVAQGLAPKLCDILEQIYQIYDKNIRLWNTLPLITNRYRSYALLHDIYNKVKEISKEDGTMLLSETKYLLSKFVADNDAPFIYEKVGNRYERIMIDEFQDTSIKEWENFVPLIKNAISQSEDTSVLIVGDVKQSIYRWRGGDWRILQSGIKEALGEENTKTIVMDENYRSTEQVVKFNNMVIENAVKVDNDKLNAELAKACKEKNISGESYVYLKDMLKNAYAGHSQTPKHESEQKGYVRVERFEQTPPLIQCIESAIDRGYSYSDIMILYRKADDGAKAAKILLDYKRQNDSFNIMTQESLVVGKAPISNFIIAMMRLSQQPNDAISKAIANDYLGREYDEPLSIEEQERLAYISQLTPEQAFEEIVMMYKLDNHKDEIAYLQAIHEQVVSFSSSKVADIQLFLKAWNEKGAGQTLSVEKGDSTIELMTIHKSKGLEKKVVIIPFCKWQLEPDKNLCRIWAKPKECDEELSEIGSFPMICNSKMQGTIYEDEYYKERVYSHIDAINMLYVALTRAKEELYVLMPKKYTATSISSLLWSAVKDRAKMSDDGEREYAEFGTPTTKLKQESKVDKAENNNILIKEYPTHSSPLWLKLYNQRYFEDEGNESTPRNIGILMHEILRQASTTESIIARIDESQIAGKLSPEQAQELKAAIEREFQREEIKEWFSEWDEIHTECDIICGDKVGTRRPDRVMIKGDRAVVVDYKFGAEKFASHRKQIAEYMRLLREMGYEQVEGYVWYLSLGEIVAIEE